jgi:Tfp pilus assembly protein PilO
MMNRSRKDVTLMVAMGALLLFAVFNFLFKPQRNALSAARGDLQRVEQSVSAADAKLRAPIISSPGQAQAASSTAIPVDPAVSTLLRQLQAIADNSRVVLASVAPNSLSANPNGPGGSLLVSISASGSHHAVQAYVAQLRDLDRLAVVEQIGISSQAATDVTGQTDQLALSVRVFTLQGPASAVAAATPTSAP